MSASESVSASDDLGQVARALAALHASTGIEGGILPQARPGAGTTVLLQVAGRALRYDCEVRKRVDRYALLPELLQKRAHLPTALLVSAPLSPEMAGRCRELGIEFIDTAGNAYLSDANGIHVYVAGRRVQDESGRAAPGAAIPPAGLKMMFAFLASPALLNAPYREIAAKADVSTGVIGKVLETLQSMGLVVAGTNGRRAIAMPERFLNEWATGYLDRLRPRIAAYRFATEDFDQWRPVPGVSAWGGEVAAAYLTKQLQPRTATVYLDMTDPATLPAMAEQCGFREQADGHVEVVAMFWGRRCFGEWFPAVPPHLVYADLLGTRDARHVPVAQQVAAQVIAHVLEAGT